MQLKQHSDNHVMQRQFRWRQLALVILLILASAICLLKYLGWAWVVSGAYGLPSQARNVGIARQLSLVYFLAGLVMEGVLIIILAIHLRLDILDLNGVPKALVRGIAALLIAGIGTVSAAFLINCIGRLFNYVWHLR